MRFFSGFVSKAPAISLFTMASISFFAAQGVAQQSPEGVAPQKPAACRSNADCPVPSSVASGKDRRCLEGACNNETGTCSVKTLTGKLLGEYTDESVDHCYVFQYECGENGERVAYQRESRKVAARDGELCQGDPKEKNSCTVHTCSEKKCIKNIDALDGKNCLESEAKPAPDVCQDAICKRGTCTSVPDPNIKDNSSVPCGPDVPLEDRCQVKKMRCTTTGECQGRSALQSGKECAPPPDNLLAPVESLPQAFRELFNDSAKAIYSCNPTTCKLEYCGDSKINGKNEPALREECDGADMPPTAPLGSRCSKDCKIMSPDCSAFAKNPNLLEVVSIQGRGTVSDPTAGSFSGPLADVKRYLISKGYTVEVAWEPGYTGGTTTTDSLALHAMALCAWKTEEPRDCASLKEKPGLKITALGISARVRCDSPLAQKAYELFKEQYPGVNSLFTGESLSYSSTQDPPYIYPLPEDADTPSWAAWRKTYCEVCYYPVCGNGIRSEGEECDGKDLGPDAQPGDSCSSECTLVSCNVKPNDPPKCAIDPVTGNGIQTRRIFSKELCGYEEISTIIEKPRSTCRELVAGYSAERAWSEQFVAKGDSCAWERKTETIISPNKVSCRYDEAKGIGYQEGSSLDTQTCQWTNKSIELTKPLPKCTEKEPGKRAELVKYWQFASANSGCAWFNITTSITNLVDPGCFESGNKATNTTAKLISNMTAATPVCRYEVTTTQVSKPANICTDLGTSAKFESYQLNKASCSYTKNVQTVSKPARSCTVQNAAAVETTYNLNTSTCQYSPLTTKFTPRPANSCTVENRYNNWYAVKRTYNNLLDTTTCSFKPSESLVATPATYECSANTGHRYQRATLDYSTCQYSVVAGTCCVWKIGVFPSGSGGLTGSRDGCIPTALTIAESACEGKKSSAGWDDCVAANIAGTWILNANNQCEKNDTAVGRLCGSATYAYSMSPISLRWLNVEPSKDLAFSRFSLSGSAENKVVVWKASSALPLLVYDPEHKGDITSAHQLFGEVFRGGKDGKDHWADGYEALGSLDSNNDDMISGPELSPLGLWFDENRDGISQQGEVKPLNHPDVNVMALFYRDGVRNNVTQDIELTIGFERISGGRVEQGGSVDWYGEEESSQLALLNALSTASFFTRMEASGRLSQRLPTPASAPSQSKPIAHHAFAWESQDPFFIDNTGYKPSGILAFSEYKDGSIRGYTIGESFVENKTGKGSKISTTQLVGSIESMPDGRRKLIFDIVDDGLQGTSVHTIAFLSGDGAQLEGRSEETLTYEGSARSYSYGWSAKRR